MTACLARAFLWLGLLGGAATGFSFTASAQSVPVVEHFTLRNQLEVYVIPNHRIPAISHMMWYRIGAADDPQGKSGLAHYHEHMMFKATKKLKTGEYSDIIARHGGQQNAFTGYDATSYYVDIAKEKLPLVMDLEADRMRGLRPSDEDASKEKDVIIEERRMRTDNNPAALLSEQVNAALYRHHPYHLPVIGWRHEMETLTKNDALDFHEKYYHPNNAILIVSGDITAAELKPLAEKYYGNLKPAKIPTRRWNQEPPQLGARRITLHHENVKQPIFARSYATDSMGYGKKENALPLFVLSQVLAGGRSSRLYQSLAVEQKIATAVDANYNPFAMGPAEACRKRRARSAGSLSPGRIFRILHTGLKKLMPSPQRKCSPLHTMRST
ncbi:MAG: insulinase family protein [Alphaproteobacteria bacterium]|nr:insulinase family protein [Alphaproteobacteria bacterium]